jgi:hypothetical protein
MNNNNNVRQSLLFLTTLLPLNKKKVLILVSPEMTSESNSRLKCPAAVWAGDASMNEVK